MEKKERLAQIFFLFFVLILGGMRLKDLTRPELLHHPFFLYDFKNYLFAVHHLPTPELVYNLKEIHPYKYSPFFLVLLSPLSSMEFSSAAWIYFIIMILAMGALVWISLEIFPEIQFSLWTLLSFILLYEYWRTSLRLGQIQSFWYLGIFLALYGEKKNAPRLGGIVLGMAAWIKLIPALFLFYFLSRKSWKTAAYFFVGIFLCNCVEIGFLGWETYNQLMRDWFHLLLVQSSQYPKLELLEFKNHSLLKVIIASLGPFPYNYEDWSWKLAHLSLPLAKTVAYLVAGGMMVETCRLSWKSAREKKEENHLLEIAMFSLLCLLLPPLVWHDYYYLLWFTVGVAFYENKKRRTPHPYQQWISLGIFLLLFFLLERIFYAFRMLRFYWFLGGETWGLVALWWNLRVLQR